MKLVSYWFLATRPVSDMSFLGAVKRILPPSVVVKLRESRKTLLFHRDRLFSVDKAELQRTLHDLGIGAGEIVYVRSSYDQMRSIRATPVEIIDILCRAVGESGTVVMPTYPMSGLSQEYLHRHPLFDWRRTPSRSGLLTEIFRRMPGTERSIHPTHPVAARGAAAAWLTEGHERSETPFDQHSPFQKLFEHDAFILTMGRFDHMTLRHFADHLIQDKIPYPIYDERLTKVRAMGKDGKEYAICTRAHNPNLACDPRIVLVRMTREGLLRTARVGSVALSLVRVQQYIDAYQRYYALGLFRHYLKSPHDIPASEGQA